MTNTIQGYLLRFLIVLGLFGYSYINVFAITSDDYKTYYTEITDKNIHPIDSYTSGSGGIDLIITSINASNKTTKLTIYNGNNILITLVGSYTYALNLVIKDDLRIEQDSNTTNTWTINGYTIIEGDDLTNSSVNIADNKFNSDDFINLAIGLGTDQRLWQVVVLYSINIMNIYLLILTIKYGFKAGYLFSKSKLQGKR